MTTTCPYGFRVVGPATGERRLVNADATFAAYAACDYSAQLHTEAYLSAFHYGGDFRQYLEDEGTTRGFDGICWAPWLWFDVDRDDLSKALVDARRLAAFVAARYCLDDDALLIFFSGNKGFHIGLPTILWRPDPSTTFHRVARRFAEIIAGKGGVGIDTGVYSKVQLFRALNSRHQKTGCHKRRLSLEELLALSLDAILHMAERPANFVVPAPEGHNQQAVADWSSAMTTVHLRINEKANRQAQAMPMLNRGTLDFMRAGAQQGDRHRLLFSAAANLAEFECPEALAHALLTEAALDCGLAPADVRRQIDCGLAHARAAPARPDALAIPAEVESPPPASHLAAQLTALWDKQAGPPPAEDQGNT